MNTCALCGTTENLEYCSACHRYFCPNCKGRYLDRGQAALSTLAANIKRVFGGVPSA
ncbi:MAG: hypothetical protein KGL39_59125 [Patescibacteria group bacterium]|nr:hypothetical protein [Patescibacteria group bacterium]